MTRNRKTETETETTEETTEEVTETPEPRQDDTTGESADDVSPPEGNESGAAGRVRNPDDDDTDDEKADE